MPIRIIDLLRKVEPETERVVMQTRQRFNQSVRRLTHWAQEGTGAAWLRSAGTALQRWGTRRTQPSLNRHSLGSAHNLAQWSRPTPTLSPFSQWSCRRRLKSSLGTEPNGHFKALPKTAGHGLGTKWAQDGHKARSRPCGAASANSLVVVFVSEFLVARAGFEPATFGL